MPILDDSAFPLVKVTFARGATDDEMREAIAAAAQVIARRQRVVFIVDATSSSLGVTVERRARIAQMMKELQADADRMLIGAVYVAPSAALRGIILAINWARGKRPYPIRVVASVDEATALGRSWINAERPAAAGDQGDDQGDDHGDVDIITRP
jgi:hypothetical protein